MQQKMRIFFIRHGESLKNIGEKFDRVDDLKDQLTSKGEDEISCLVRFLQNNISENESKLFITGNRARVIETTKLLSKHLLSDYIVIEGLKPINPGDLSGLSYDEAFEKFPEIMNRRKLFVQNLISGYEVIFTNGDLFKDYEVNMKQCIDNIIKQNQSFQNIFIITHRSVILAALNIYNKMLGQQDESIYKYYSTPNGYILELIYDTTFPLSLISYGGIDEWGKML